MLKIKASSWEGVGEDHIAIIPYFPPELYDVYQSPTQLVGQEVEIDGTVYYIKHLERQNIGAPEGSPFRLTIR